MNNKEKWYSPFRFEVFFTKNTGDYSEEEKISLSSVKITNDGMVFTRGILIEECNSLYDEIYNATKVTIVLKARYEEKTKKLSFEISDPMNRSFNNIDSNSNDVVVTESVVFRKFKQCTEW